MRKAARHVEEVIAPRLLGRDAAVVVTPGNAGIPGSVEPVADERGITPWLSVPAANAAERQRARFDEGATLAVDDLVQKSDEKGGAVGANLSLGGGFEASESVTITLRMDPRMLARIKRLARSRFLNYQSMMKQWLSERMESELREREPGLRQRL